MRHSHLFLLVALVCLALVPETALAGGIYEFAGPIQRITDTLQGPTGKLICVFMIVICAIGYFFQRGEEIAGIWKAALGVIMLITIVSYGDVIVGSLFSFKGATV
jgi:type IV secretory pathway VirB2 component (pilin)